MFVDLARSSVAITELAAGGGDAITLTLRTAAAGGALETSVALQESGRLVVSGAWAAGGGGGEGEWGLLGGEALAGAALELRLPAAAHGLAVEVRVAGRVQELAAAAARGGALGAVAARVGGAGWLLLPAPPLGGGGGAAGAPGWGEVRRAAR